MASKRHQLAQANIARMRGRLEDPIMDGFRKQLDWVNAVADRSPGFVWRLQTPEGDATTIRVFDDDRILFNMSVWDSLEALHQYVYGSDHVGPLRNRRDWFEPVAGPNLVLWWIPMGAMPTIEEAKTKLQMLKDQGPSPLAFTMRRPFPPPGMPPTPFPEVGAEFCGGTAC